MSDDHPPEQAPINWFDLPKKCPHCGNTRFIKHIYGYVLINEHMLFSEDYVFEGCIITRGLPRPLLHCASCGYTIYAKPEQPERGWR